MRDSNNIQTAIHMFLRSNNMIALVSILSYVRVSSKSKMAACNRRWIYTTHLPQTLMWKSIRISPIMMLNAKNIGMTVRMSLLSCIQAEKYVISYPLPVTFRHFCYITHPDVGECSYLSYLVSGPHKWQFLWKFADITFVSWDPSYIRSVSRHFKFVWL